MINSIYQPLLSGRQTRQRGAAGPAAASVAVAASAAAFEHHEPIA
jgi:hypothetical protein